MSSASSLLTRRGFLGRGLAIAGVGLLSGCVGRLQQPQPSPGLPLIGFLWEGGPAPPPELDLFQRALEELGYRVGREIAIDARFAAGQPERLPSLAGQLVGRRVEVLVTYGSKATRAARGATSSIPIVMIAGSDLVGAELLAGLARPGSNLTGPVTVFQDLLRKRLNLLQQSFPGLGHLAVFFDSTSSDSIDLLKPIEVVTRSWDAEFQPIPVSTSEDVDLAFSLAAQGGADSLITLPSAVLAQNRARLVGLAARYRLPATYPSRDFVDSGGLMAYGVSRSETFRHAASYVDRILRGVRPADLPIEPPTSFEFVINQRAAQELGRTIPPYVLVQATEVLE